MVSNAIFDFPVDEEHAKQSIALDQETPAPPNEGEVVRRLFTIRAADSFGQRSSANILVNRMYATRGYQTGALTKAQASNRITLVAGEGDTVFGTMTIGFDCPHGLLVDELFRDETDPLRQAGRQLCEFTKFAVDRAVDSAVKSKRMLASLFHVAYIIVHRLNGFDNLMIEVNPRHVRYYERMLGFEVKGSQRMNPRVNAPAVLMSLSLEHGREMIAEFAGRPDLASSEKSLYPFFISPAEEAGIINRLQPNSGAIAPAGPETSS